MDMSKMQHLDTILTLKKKLKALQDYVTKMEQTKRQLEEEKNVRRAKETLLTLAMQKLEQETEKTISLRKNLLETVNQNVQKSTQLRELEFIEAKLRSKMLEEQHRLYEAERSVTEMQLQQQKMTLKLHEVEGHLVMLESQWVITPRVQSYAGMPRARSFSADQVLMQNLSTRTYNTRRRSLDHSIKFKSNKQEKSTVEYQPSAVNSKKYRAIKSHCLEEQIKPKDISSGQSHSSVLKLPQAMAVSSTPKVLEDVAEVFEEPTKPSGKRCLSPSLCVGRVKKLRAEESRNQLKTHLPRLKKNFVGQKLQHENFRSALLYATKREDVLTIRRLATIGGGARLLDMPVVRIFQFTPLHLAASWGHMESARALLDCGAGLEVQDWVKSTPLHIAAHWGYAKMCRLLLGRGAQIKACNCNEETPLHLAAKQGHIQVVRMLVDDWKAELNIKDSTGRTPWDVANFWKKTLVANWLARQHKLKKHFGRQHRSRSLPCATFYEE